MRSTLQGYLEAIVTVAWMVTIGIVLAFITAGITNDRAISVGAGCVATVLTGAVLVARLWWLARPPLVQDSPPPE